MKYLFILSISTLLIISLALSGCNASKKALEKDDPTQLAVYMLVELKKDVLGNVLQSDLSSFEILEIKKTNKTLNQYQYKVLLKKQTADQLLLAARSFDYVLSANIINAQGGPAQNLESGQMKKSGPVKG